MEGKTALITKAKEGDSRALEALVSENTGLVRSIAVRFTGRGVDYEDLCQIGHIGMIKAIRNFDEKFDVKFSEGFPQLVDAALEANSATYIQQMERAKNVISEVEELTKEAEIKTKKLMEKSESVEEKADVVLGQTKKAHSDFNSIINFRLSITVYIVLFFLFWCSMYPL